MRRGFAIPQPYDKLGWPEHRSGVMIAGRHVRKLPVGKALTDLRRAAEDQGPSSVQEMPTRDRNGDDQQQSQQADAADWLTGRDWPERAMS